MERSDFWSSDLNLIFIIEQRKAVVQWFYYTDRCFLMFKMKRC